MLKSKYREYPYKYSITITYTDAYASGQARVIVSTNRALKSKKDYAHIEESIRVENNYKAAVIINVIKLRG